MGHIEVKRHPPVLHGEITLIDHDLGHGWLRADDGREVYFQKDALAGGDWSSLSIGMRLGFREMQAEQGPYAMGLSPVC